MLHVHAADRLAPLAAGLARVLAEQPTDPFTPEWVAVPAEGMRRWLALELARHLGAGPGGGDGIAANITPAFPGSLRTALLDAEREEHEADPWGVERLVWPVLEVLAGAAEDPVLAPRFAVDGSGRAPRFGRARRIADLLDRYHVHRPAMVRAWAAGDDRDAFGQPLPPGARWQPHLWRAVRRAVGEPGPAERWPDVRARFAAGELECPRLPHRLVVFGVSVLPGGSGFAELAEAVAAQRELHLFLLDPSPATSARIGASAAAAPSTTAGSALGGLRPRAADRSGDLVAHPLLRSWGRMARETAVLLPRPSPAPPTEPVHREAAAPRLLHALQADLRAGAAPRGDLVVADDDRSIQFHATHGPTRQVEVLRDALLHLLAADPTLTEDDVLVVCPALDRFAPLVEAGFGAPAPAAPASGAPPAPPEPDALPRIRYRIADRSLRRANPVLAGLAAVLELSGSRFEGPAVLDLAAQTAVRERYRFTDQELTRLAGWVADANVRWGLDAEHRAGFGIPASITTNTWRAAIDRLLVGAAVGDDDTTFAIGGVVPFGIEGDDVDLAGRMADLLGRIGRLARAIDEVHPLGTWIDLVEDATAGLLAAPRGEEWQLDALQTALGELREQAGERGERADLGLTSTEARRILIDHVAEAPGRVEFFRGGATVTSADSLRWVPHRIVCLLGMDQQAFAPAPADGDDLVAAAPALGDREPRSERRQAILEAVLAAGDHLVVVRDGHDVRTNQEIPRAVVVAELCDALTATVSATAHPTFARDLEVHHPRQAFDERNLCPTPLGSHTPAPWSFDPGARDGAVARRTRTDLLPPFLDAPLAARPASAVELADLHAVLDKPARVFVTHRLEARLPRSEDAPVSRLPVAVQALAEWKVADRLLRTRLEGLDVEQQVLVEHATGTLPPGVLGTKKVDALLQSIDLLAAEAARLQVRPGPATHHPVDLLLPDGTRVLGSVALRLDGPEPGAARVGYSRHKPVHHLAAWLDLLALVASAPEVPWRSVAINRDPKDSKKTPVTALELVPVGADAAERRAAAEAGLQVVVDLLRRARREPIPLFPRLSHAVVHDQAKPIHWVRSTDKGSPGDREEPHAEVAFGHLDLEQLLALPARPDDPPGTGGRVARFAAALWGSVAATSELRGDDPDDDAEDVAP